MLRKRLVSAIATLSLLVTLCVPAYALQGNEASVDEVGKAINTVSNSLMELSDTASSGEAKSLAEAFSSFMEVATTAGKLLTLINGSTTFLRLIGIMTDPTQAKLSSILSQLQVIDERLSSMDDKLNDLTTAMSELKASVEFNARTEKAILYESSWRDFEYRYMEDGMDKLITQYNSMLRTGLMSWCSGSRNENGVDNTGITVLYGNVGGEYKLTFSDQNGVPTGMTDGDRWIVIPAECLPESFSYDVNSFGESLAADIASRISDAVSSGDLGIFETHNYPLLTEEGAADITQEDINALAADAVNTLIFRVASSKVNGDSAFAGEVSRQFANYCSHLQTSGDGLDATLKTFYLTHAFEYSVADELKDFCDRMIIITGTYGMFAANVLGMSHLTTDAEKVAAVSRMTSAIEMAEQAKENGITGNGNYCYITGTDLEYTTVRFSASAALNAHYTISNTAYESCNGTAPSAKYGSNINGNAAPAGDAALIVLVNTLLSNGIIPDHDYLSENLGDGAVENYGKIVTGYSAVQTLPFDGKTKLHVKNAFGDYFGNNSTITSLPEDAEPEYMVFRKKISGSLYDLSSGSLTSNTTLCAVAAYGENHFYWVTDEGALMGGPSDSTSFKDEYSLTETGKDSRGVFRQHLYTVENSYNIVLSVPNEKPSLAEENAYDPLGSLEADVPPCEYDESIYVEEDGEMAEPQDGSARQEGASGLMMMSGAENTDSDGLLGAQAESKQSSPVAVIIVAAAVIAAAAVLFFVLRKKKK